MTSFFLLRIVYNIEPYSVRDPPRGLEARLALDPAAKVELFNLAGDPYEKNNLVDSNPEKVTALQKRADDLAQGAAKPLFLVEQMKLVM